MSRRLATQQQAAEHFGVTDRTIRAWISKGYLTGFRLPSGRAIRVDLNEIENAAKVIPAVARVVHPFGPRARIVTVAEVAEDGEAAQ